MTLGSKSSKILMVVGLLFFAALTGCKPFSEDDDGQLKWGVHRLARNANILNMLPNQSVEVCADRQDWVAASHEAIQKWATAIDRWGHMKVVNCGQAADLTIRVSPGDMTGLNYFTARPGRILIKSGASGNFLRAISLHEFGHSFGLCDQYKDAGSAGCSDAKSARQENSEVMGATNASKLNLTMGDIEGVRKAASDMSVRANQAWQNYLLNAKQKSQSGSAANAQPAPQQQNSALNRKVYASLVTGGAPDRPKLAVSVVEGASVAVCKMQFGQKSCTVSSSSSIPMQKVKSANGRDFYVSNADVGGITAGLGLALIATVKDMQGSATEKFSIKKK